MLHASGEATSETSTTGSGLDELRVFRHELALVDGGRDAALELSGLFMRDGELLPHTEHVVPGQATAGECSVERASSVLSTPSLY